MLSIISTDFRSAKALVAVWTFILDKMLVANTIAVLAPKIIIPQKSWGLRSIIALNLAVGCDLIHGTKLCGELCIFLQYCGLSLKTKSYVCSKNLANLSCACGFAF